MAGTQDNLSSLSPDFYLNAKEQDLLLNALNSNMPPVTSTPPASGRPSSLYGVGNRPSSNPQHTQSGESPMYASPNQQTPGSAGLTGVGFQGSPFLDGELDEANFDWDVNGDLIGGLPVASGDFDDPEGEEEHGEKRKSPEGADNQTGERKRPENEDKTSKKPGRKPLTSEPTTKRKAQNRAAQRAFRERKEKHLKDLETKVDDLEKASEATNHENVVLRQQVERLQTELKEYRRRLSSNTSPYGNGGSPTSYSAISNPYASKRNWDINNNFQFDFPAFGGQEPRIKHRSSTSSSQDFGPLLRQDGSITNTPFPFYQNVPKATQVNNSPIANGTPGDYSSNLFSPSTVNSADSRTGSLDNNAAKPSASRHGSQASAILRASRQNSAPSQAKRNGSEAAMASPASHSSNLGLASSSATSPESAADSPGQHKVSEAGANDSTQGNGNKTGNQEDYSSTASSLGNPATPGYDLNNFNWLADQNGGAFDPVLFADYRDPQDNIMNNELAGSGFFSDAFPLPDFGVPAMPAKPLTPVLPKKKDLMQEIEERQEGKEPEVKPEQEPKHFLTCNLLWDRVQRSDKVQSGEADMDDLCSQLKSKAKCSGSGPVISQSDVDKILGPAPDPARQADVWKMFK